MLKGIDPLLGPDLLHALAAMGHGDTIALVDANFPATSRGPRILRLSGAPIDAVLSAVLSVLPLDEYVASPAQIMQVVGNPAAEPEVFAVFRRQLAELAAPAPETLERHAFYAAASDAFAIVQTGERRLYGNIILRKGVIGPASTVTGGAT